MPSNPNEAEKKEPVEEMSRLSSPLRRIVGTLAVFGLLAGGITFVFAGFPPASDLEGVVQPSTLPSTSASIEASPAGSENTISDPAVTTMDLDPTIADVPRQSSTTTKASVGPSPTASPSSTTTAASSTTTAVIGPQVRISPGESIQAAIDSHPAGTAFLLEAGVHHGKRITPKDGNSISGEAGAVLSGRSQDDLAFVGGASNVTIAGLVIEFYQSPPQFGAIHAVGDTWTIRNNEIRNNAGGGVKVGDNFRLLDNFIHHNGQIGVIGFEARDALIQGNEIAFNNHADQYQMQWEAGGAKLVKTTGLIMRANYVHDNHGPGLWTDGDNIDALIEGNRVINNYGPGIMHEISYAAVIRNNVVEGNAYQFFVGGILVSSSSDTEVYGNTVRNNHGGIAAVQEARGSGLQGPYEVRNLWVHDNLVQIVDGWHGLRQNIANTGVYSWNNRFTGNDYVAVPTAKLWYWMNGLRTLEQWLAYGLDAS